MLQVREAVATALGELFQRAPTLGGECYVKKLYEQYESGEYQFQRAPTLGGECYWGCSTCGKDEPWYDVSTGTHPWG